jgi:hypothetical protein
MSGALLVAATLIGAPPTSLERDTQHEPQSDVPAATSVSCWITCHSQVLPMRSPPA